MGVKESIFVCNVSVFAYMVLPWFPGGDRSMNFTEYVPLTIKMFHTKMVTIGIVVFKKKSDCKTVNARPTMHYARPWTKTNFNRSPK